jgi:sugar lactone lactonase YvrE
MTPRTPGTGVDNTPSRLASRVSDNPWDLVPLRPVLTRCIALAVLGSFFRLVADPGPERTVMVLTQLPLVALLFVVGALPQLRRSLQLGLVLLIALLGDTICALAEGPPRLLVLEAIAIWLLWRWQTHLCSWLLFGRVLPGVRATGRMDTRVWQPRALPAFLTAVQREAPIPDGRDDALKLLGLEPQASDEAIKDAAHTHETSLLQSRNAIGIAEFLRRSQAWARAKQHLHAPRIEHVPAQPRLNGTDRELALLIYQQPVEFVRRAVRKPATCLRVLGACEDSTWLKEALGPRLLLTENQTVVKPETPPPPVQTAQAIFTVAGDHVSGYHDGVGTQAQFNVPLSLVIDSTQTIYVSDSGNHSIRCVSSNARVTTLAGSGKAGNTNGMGTDAQFDSPFGIALDDVGNLYVADHNNHCIRRINPNGVVTTLAGAKAGYANGPGNVARFYGPVDVVVDRDGTIYVTDSFNHRIRRVGPNGAVKTLTGLHRGFADGKGERARFNFPRGLTIDGHGNLYVADSANHRIRKVSPSGEVTTLAGSGQAGYADGMANSARFHYPWGIAVDEHGNVYVADTDNHCIRKISPDGFVTTLAGVPPGQGDDGPFKQPTGIACRSGVIYVTDAGHNRICTIT